MINLSYTKCDTFLRCRMRYYWIYVEHLTPKSKTIPLMVGDLVHRLLDQQTRGILTLNRIRDLVQYVQSIYPDEPEEQVKIVALEAGRLINGYVAKYEEDDIQIHSPEMHLEGEYRGFKLYTRLDAVAVTPDERRWRLERKTTARFDSRFLVGEKKGLQTGIAHWLMEDQLPFKTAGTIFDLIVKTQIPQYERTPFTKVRWLINNTKKCVRGIVRSIKREDFYPSGACDGYNKTCSYQVLCRKDTKELRRIWFVNREEVRKHQKSID